jgi:hypothetical protein
MWTCFPCCPAAQVKPFRLGFLLAAFAIALGSSPLAFAQTPVPTTPAPLPVPIITAKKIFIANAGGEGDPYGELGYRGGSGRTYNEFYSAMKSWGHYELMSDPANADLVFEIGFTIRALQSAPGSPLSDPELRSLHPRFRLVIRDGKTHFLLWTLTEHVELARLQGNRDKNFEQALEALVRQTKQLAARAAPDHADAKSR